MTKRNRAAADQEPMGIVIAHGARAESPSVIRAYEWGPAPDAGAEDVKTTQAA